MPKSSSATPQPSACRRSTNVRAACSSSTIAVSVISKISEPRGDGRLLDAPLDVFEHVGVADRAGRDVRPAPGCRRRPAGRPAGSPTSRSRRSARSARRRAGTRRAARPSRPVRASAAAARAGRCAPLCRSTIGCACSTKRSFASASSTRSMIASVSALRRPSASRRLRSEMSWKITTQPWMPSSVWNGVAV